MMAISPEGYTIDGKFYRRVSSLLKEYGLIPAYRENGYSMEFGTHIHKACELWDKGTLDIDNLDPALRPYVNEYIKFTMHDVAVDLTTHIEHLFVSKKYGFAGRVDRIIFHNIYDLKTGKPSDWHGVQLAMYKILARENKVKIDKCHALYLTATGHKVQAYNEQKYMAVALAILTIKNYKEK